MTPGRDAEGQQNKSYRCPRTCGNKNSCCTRRPWHILVLCCVLAFTSQGMALGMGAIFRDLMDTFHTSRASAALVQSLCSGLGFGAGVIAGPFLRHFGPRVTAVVGSLLCTVGCIISFLATDISLVIIGLGTIAGVGVAYLYLTAQVVVGLLFEDIKNVAVSVVVASSAVGTTCFPLLLRHLVHTYALRGAFLILAAISLQLVVIGVFTGTFIPQKPQQPRAATHTEQPDNENAPCLDDQSKVDPKSVPDSHLVDKISHELENLSAKTEQTNPTLSKTDDNFSEKPEQSVQDLNGDSTQKELRSALVVDQLPLADAKNKDGREQQISRNGSLNQISTPPSSTTEADLKTSVFEEEQGPELKEWNNQIPLHRKSSKDFHVKPNGIDSEKGLLGTLEKDATEIRQEDRKEQVEDTTEKGKNRLLSALQLEVFKNATYSIFVFFGVPVSMSFLAPALFLADMVKASGLDVEVGSLLLTVMFAGNVVGRILTGMVAHFLLKKKTLVIFGVAAIAGGVTSFCFTLANTYTAYVAVAVTYGFCFGMTTSSIPINVISIVQPGLYAVGLGYVSFMAGMSMLLAGPVGGTIRDHTGSYVPMFYLSLGQGLCAGCLMLVAHVLTNRRRRWDVPV